MTFHNPVGLPLLPDSEKWGFELEPELSPQDTVALRALLDKAGIGDQPNLPAPQIPFSFPDSLGSNIDEHFNLMSKELFADLLVEIEKTLTVDPKFPSFDISSLQPGWNFVDFDGDVHSIDLPNDTFLIYDCETFVKGSDLDGGHPVIATAIGSAGHYIWLHPNWLDPDNYAPVYVPLRDNSTIAAHNATFDYQRIEQAWTDKLMHIDTMSMHMALNGLMSEQRYWFESKEKRYIPDWVRVGCPNDLASVAAFHTGIHLSKDTREIFVEAENFRTIVDSAPDTIPYAIRDTEVLHEVFVQLWKKWTDPSTGAQKNWLSFGGLALLSRSRLPVNPQWDSWFNNVERLYDEYNSRIAESLVALAHKVFEDWRDDAIDPERCPWLSQLKWKTDWKVTKNGKKGKYYGIPEWYRPIFRGESIGTKTTLAHILLRITYLGEPVIKTSHKGYCYGTHEETLERIPHPEKPGENVGGLLGQGFMEEWDSGILASSDPDSSEILKLSIQTAYWTSVRSRIADVHKRGDLVLPNLVPHNTFSRRTGESLWLTVPGVDQSKAVQDRKLGSEIKSMVQAPAGRVFVGFDVDSEEQMIAAIFGDTRWGISGSSPLGYSLMVGDKNRGTDQHSLTAKQFGMSRADAKTLNYCVPLDISEALTPNGWIPISKLKVGDLIIGYNERTGELEPTPVTSMYIGLSHTDLVESRVDHRFRFISTSDHRWVSYYRGSKKSCYGYKNSTLSTNELSQQYAAIQNAAIFRPKPQLEISEDEAELIAWIYGDGCITRDHSGGENARKYCIKQISFCDKLDALLKRLGIVFSKSKDGCYYLSRPTTRDILQRAGLPYLEKTQHLDKFILSMSCRQRSAWINGMFWAEGSKSDTGSIHICQSNEVNPGISDAIQLALYLNGHISVQHKDYVAGYHRSIVTGQRLKNTVLNGTKGSVLVGCPTTSLDTWVLRQGKHITITRNCIQYGGGAKKLAITLWLGNKRKGKIDDYLPVAKRFLEGKKGKANYGTKILEGGTDSDIYNYTRRVVYSDEPRDPVARFAMSLAARADVCGSDYHTGRSNWFSE